MANESDTVTAELVPVAQAADAEVDVHDPETAAVLAALDQAAREHNDRNRPRKTRTGYERDWTVWGEYHDWLAERTGHRLPLTAVTVGTLVGFVVWLDTVIQAAPNTIDRRITGVTVEARRRHGVTVPKEATLEARKTLKPMKLDPVRQARGRGKAIAATPEHLRKMNTAKPKPKTGRKKKPPHRLALLRDASLSTMAFAVAGRAEEVSALEDDGITLVAEGLRVHVPSVKGRPARTVAVAYGEHPETCPVRCWQAWKAAAGINGGPAYRSVSESGRLGTGRLSADGCRIVITRAGQRAQLEVRLTGHSARAGLITTGRKKGKRAEKLRAQSGHSANSPVFWEYVRDGELWEDAATDGIGL